MKMQEYTAQAIADFIQNAKNTKAGPQGQHDAVRLARASAQEGGGQHVWTSSKKAKRSAAAVMERESKKTKLDEESAMQAEKATHGEKAAKQAEKAAATQAREAKQVEKAAKKAEKAAKQAEKAAAPKPAGTVKELRQQQQENRRKYLAQQAEKAAAKQAEKDQKAETSTQDAQADADAGRMIMQAKDIMMAQEDQMMERFEQKIKARTSNSWLLSQMAMYDETATTKQAETAYVQTTLTPFMKPGMHPELVPSREEAAASKPAEEAAANLIGDIRDGVDKVLKDRFVNVPDDKKDEWKDGQVSHGSIPSYRHIIYVYMLCICM